MTNTELKQLRKLLFLDVTEAAKLIGECKQRSWQRWESGSRAIPEYFKAAEGGGNELKWRLAQSVSAQLVCEKDAYKWRKE